ncbi:MAG: hypothetical protein KKG50_05065, partial [Candidatus Omnitrophica bacterium]|nr:hypothetical protein [Candidatus Omnitrophota bacterium]
MILFIEKRKAGVSFKAIVFFLIIAFLASSLVIYSNKPAPKAYASALSYMPAPTKLINTSPKFSPPLLRGIKFHFDDPFKFDFIIEQGDAKPKEEELKQEASKLIKYFLSSLTIPEEDLWVNLSPYEQNKVIPTELGLTDMGKDLLGEDYVLKQLLASLTYPESPLGKIFWDKVYKRAFKLFGTTNIPINTFNKIWIVPEKAVVYEDKDKAIVGESKLQVMLEQDYLALRNREQVTEDKLPKGVKKLTEKEVEDINSFSSKIMKEVVLPVIEEEINNGKNFSHLRQIYHSLILAVWFKQKLKTQIGADIEETQINADREQMTDESILSKVYIDKKKIKGIDTDDPKIKEKIYNQYLEAYKKGVYNYIKKDFHPQERRHIQRRYYSGGCDFREIVSSAIIVRPITALPQHVANSPLTVTTAQLSPFEREDLVGGEGLGGSGVGRGPGGGSGNKAPKSKIKPEEVKKKEKPLEAKKEKKVSSAVEKENKWESFRRKLLPVILAGSLFFNSTPGSWAEALKNRHAVIPKTSVEISQVEKDNFSYDLPWLLENYTHRNNRFYPKEKSSLPQVPKEQFWWFNKPIEPQQFSNEDDFIRELMESGKIKNVFLPFVKLLYVFPILTKENTKISGEAIRQYFQPDGNIFQKGYGSKITIGDTKDLESIAAIASRKKGGIESSLQGEGSYSVENAKDFAMIFFNTLPLHLVDYVERVDKEGGRSYLHIHFKKPYEIKTKIKTKVLEELVSIPFYIPLFGAIDTAVKWEQDVYVDFKIFTLEYERMRDNKQQKMEEKVVVYKDIQGASIDIEGLFITRAIKAIDKVISKEWSIKDLFNLEDWYTAFYPYIGDDAKTIDTLIAGIGIPSADLIPHDKVNTGLFFDSSTIEELAEGIYDVASMSRGKPLTESIFWPYIYGEEKTQRWVRLSIINSWADYSGDGLENLIKRGGFEGIEENGAIDSNSLAKLRDAFNDIKRERGPQARTIGDACSDIVKDMVAKVFDVNFKDSKKSVSAQTLKVRKGVRKEDIKGLQKLINSTYKTNLSEGGREILKMLQKELIRALAKFNKDKSEVEAETKVRMAQNRLERAEWKSKPYDIAGRVYDLVERFFSRDKQEEIIDAKIALHEAEDKLGELVQSSFQGKVASSSLKDEKHVASSAITTNNPASKPNEPNELNRLGKCLTPDSLIHLADGTKKPLIELKEGDYVLSLNQDSGLRIKDSMGSIQHSTAQDPGRLEPHRVNALLDMGVKPVYRITTKSGKQLKTTLNHPYLTKRGWRKLKDIKVGSEIAVINSVSLSSQRDFGNQDIAVFPVKDNPIVTRSETVNFPFFPFDRVSIMERITSRDIKSYFFNDEFLNVGMKFTQLPVSMFGEAVGNHLRPKRFSISLEDIRPDFRDFSISFQNSGLEYSIDSNKSMNASLSRKNPLVLRLSPSRTTRTKPVRNFLGSLRNWESLTTFSFNNNDGTIFSPPYLKDTTPIYLSQEDLKITYEP